MLAQWSVYVECASRSISPIIAWLNLCIYFERTKSVRRASLVAIAPHQILFCANLWKYCTFKWLHMDSCIFLCIWFGYFVDLIGSIRRYKLICFFILFIRYTAKKPHCRWNDEVNSFHSSASVRRELHSAHIHVHSISLGIFLHKQRRLSEHGNATIIVSKCSSNVASVWHRSCVPWKPRQLSTVYFCDRVGKYMSWNDVASSLINAARAPIVFAQTDKTCFAKKETEWKRKLRNATIW